VCFLPLPRENMEDFKDKGQRVKIRALSFNIWGVPVSIDRPKRILAFCHHIAVPDQYDVVGIQVCHPLECACSSRSSVLLSSVQEAFIESDRRAIIASARNGGLLYAHYFYSGMGFPLGGEPSGMLVLSRFPIVQVAYHRYHQISFHLLLFVLPVNLTRLSSCLLFVGSQFFVERSRASPASLGLSVRQRVWAGAHPHRRWAGGRVPVSSDR
jgi:hypothetical protein